MNNIIEVNNLSFGYTRHTNVLSGIGFNIQLGSFLAIAGPNGAGKSTLLNLLCRTLKPSTGTIKIDGQSIGSYTTKSLSGKIAVVRQESAPVFGFTVIETVMMARTALFGPMGFESDEDRRNVDNALHTTDTAQFAARPLANLSSGERQRVFIARALSQDTPILLLDEPTSFLDMKHQVSIYELLKTAQVTGKKTIVLVTHNLNLAAQYCDQILLLGISDAAHGAHRPDHKQAIASTFRIGKTEDVFTAEQIEAVFNVTVRIGKIGSQKIMLPITKSARADNHHESLTTDSHSN